MKVICVTGVAGSGKTYFAKKLAKENKYKYVDVNNIIEQNKEVVSSYDKKFKTKIVDTNKLNKILIELIEKSSKKLVIDSHLSHYLDKKYVSKVYVVKTSVKKLRSRLKKRGYLKNKVEENVEAELMDICFHEAKELGHNVEVVEN
tara:strand:- start:78 stop:515 length:438 start_codon:yes stop_codon:yes gene_type:complete